MLSTFPLSILSSNYYMVYVLDTFTQYFLLLLFSGQVLNPACASAGLLCSERPHYISRCILERNVVYCILVYMFCFPHLLKVCLYIVIFTPVLSDTIMTLGDDPLRPVEKISCVFHVVSSLIYEYTLTHNSIHSVSGFFV